jgi:regulatory protein
MAPPTPYQKALQLLATRAHFRRELEAKLRQRRYPEEEIEAALAKLTAEGYLDDRATARVFVESRQERASEGRTRLRAELVKRGAPDDAVEAALAELTPEDDLPAAREAAESWRRKGGVDPRALARHLERKGFSRRAIVSVLNGELDDLEIDDGS